MEDAVEETLLKRIALIRKRLDELGNEPPESKVKAFDRVKEGCRHLLSLETGLIRGKGADWIGSDEWKRSQKIVDDLETAIDCDTIDEMIEALTD
jgi:hypothetical protein